MPEPLLPELIPVSRLRLALDNSRHRPLPSEAEAIKRLLKKEKVVELAKDIARLGANPMENIGVVKNKRGNSYTVVEGNRRACALVLLNDPKKAPSSYRTLFKSLKERHDIQSMVLAQVFPNQGVVDPWLDRMHDGEAKGIGRRAWNVGQKARRDPTNPDRPAFDLVSYAADEDLVVFDDFENLLTTVQRFVGNPRFRAAIGMSIDRSQTIGFTYSRPKRDFDEIIRRFLSDMTLVDSGTPKSRYNSDQVADYAKNLLASLGFKSLDESEEGNQEGEGSTGDEDLDGPNNNNGGASDNDKSRRSQGETTFVRKNNRLVHDTRISIKLKNLGKIKLERLYRSLISVPLNKNTVLLSVGIWSFVESLTSMCGRKEATSFKVYINSQWQNLGLPTERGEKNSVTDAVARLSQYGNTTKHHHTGAAFNSEQLNNDLEVISDVILACIERAQQNLSSATKASN